MTRAPKASVRTDAAGDDPEPAAPGVVPPSSRGIWPDWDPAVTVSVRNLPALGPSEPAARRSVLAPGRATVISRRPPGPNAGFGSQDLVHLPFETPGRYVYALPGGEASSEIGRGGIGRVLLCLDQHLGREVALKELLPSASGNLVVGDALNRFLGEARITGQLEHPNIVPVYELGRRSDGRLYYAMRVVRGETLAEVLDRAESLDERLALLPHLGRVCNAIAYAHSRAVVHRDIKPENIMIGEFGETVVLDWGIAKLRGESSEGVTRMPRGIAPMEATADGEVVGTPLFMSPEQATGGEVDEATDVWSLGVVLYLILCGKPPFVAASLQELKQKLLHQRPQSVRRNEPRVPRELAAITQCALERDKNQRYRSAAELARDLDAFMAGAKVSVYSYSWLDSLARFARRHRAASWVALVAVVVLLSAAVLSQRRILRARDRAVAAERTALEQGDIARRSLSEFFSERAQAAQRDGDLAGAQINAAWALTQSTGPVARGIIVALSNQTGWEPVQVPGPVLSPVSSVSSVQRRLTLDERGGVVLAGQSGDLLATKEAGLEPTTIAELSEQGDLVALGGRMGKLTLWWPEQGRELSLDGHRGTVVGLGFSADGQMLASAGADRTLSVWSTRSGQLRFPSLADVGHVAALGFSPDNHTLAIATSEHRLVVLDTQSPNDPIWLRVAMTGVDRLRFSDPETLVAYAGPSAGQAWKRRTPASGTSPAVLPHRGNVLAQVFIDSTTLVTAGIASEGVCLWDLAPGRCATRLPAQGEEVRALAFSPQLSLLGVGTSSGQVLVWDVKTALPVRVLQAHSSAVRGLSFDSDGKTLLSASSGGEIASWRVSSGELDWKADAGDGVFDAKYDPKTASFWLALRDGSLQAWDGRGQRTRRGIVHTDWVMGLAFDPTLSTVASASGDGSIVLTDLRTLQLRQRQAAHVGRALSIDASSDGRYLASGGEDGEVLLWRAASLELVARLAHHRGAVRSVRFSPSNTLLTSAGDDGTVRVWDLQRLEQDPRQLVEAVESAAGVTIEGTKVVVRGAQ